MDNYEKIRQQYKPKIIKILLIAESPPPSAHTQSSRHFYRAEKIRRDDRLFVNTVKALYPEAAALTESELEPNKEMWLRKIQADGIYMIETLPSSLPHETTKEQRQKLIAQHLPQLIEKIKTLVNEKTGIVLIKSNPFDMAAEPLRHAGFRVLNKRLVDYPGHFNQRAYREKLVALLK